MSSRHGRFSHKLNCQTATGVFLKSLECPHAAYQPDGFYFAQVSICSAISPQHILLGQIAVLPLACTSQSFSKEWATTSFCALHEGHRLLWLASRRLSQKLLQLSGRAQKSKGCSWLLPIHQNSSILFSAMGHGWSEAHLRDKMFKRQLQAKKVNNATSSCILRLALPSQMHWSGPSNRFRAPNTVYEILWTYSSVLGSPLLHNR